MSALSTALPKRDWSGEFKTVGYRLLAVVVMCIALSLVSDAFFTWNNLLNVLRQAALLFLLASGLTLVILTAGLDLSVGANVALSACLAGTVMKATGSPLLGAALGLACGTLIGAGNGLLVTTLRIPPFIATYGMLWVVHGATYWYMAGSTVHGFPAGFRALGSGYWLGIPIPVYLMFLFFAIGALFAQRTTWGQEI